MKTQPCAKLEAWVDPTVYSDPKKAIEEIGKKLQSHYEALSTRTRYKLSLDPNVEDTKRFCISLRRSAKDERILFHYNGHGVPKPTASGEIWVFNKGYTQYIPVSLYDLQSWLGAPCIFVYDCHAAGFIVSNYLRFVEKRRVDEADGNNPPSSPSAKAFQDCIHLAACASDETLPMNPDLPADLFTSCLTSPIEMAVRWFVLQSPISRKYYTELKIPGHIAERRTPLGELNWIFTSITDTIAWTLFPRVLFKKLFRQDLVVAALFRNFLLAERIMRVHNCHPISYPSLPPTHDHPMWDAWDLAVDHCLTQLPALNAASKPDGKPYEYKPSKFFEEQLTAFELWLKYKSKDLDTPPEQLPVVLQVLLSHIHRVRALVLLSRYLDLGPKAVYLALSIGIFPYVLKLLQSPAQEIKPVLVFIWSRIMVVDYLNIRHELLKDDGFNYFVSTLVPEGGGFVINTINRPEHQAMCALIISLFCRKYKVAQQKCTSIKILNGCINNTNNYDYPLLRQWSCLCIAQIWDGNFDAKWLAISEGIPDRLIRLLVDAVPEVRASCVIALTTFIDTNVPSNLPEEAKAEEKKFAKAVLSLSDDASFLVRREVICFFSRFVKQHLNQMLVCAFTSLEDEATLLNQYVPHTSAVYPSPAQKTLYNSIWRLLLVATEDPYAEVADYAKAVVDYILELLEVTILKEEAEGLEDQIIQSTPKSISFSPIKTTKSSTIPEKSYLSQFNNHPAASAPVANINGSSNVSESPDSNHSVSTLASTLKRSVSFAATLRQAWSSTDSFSSLTNPQPVNTPGAVSTVPYGYGKVPKNPRYTPYDPKKKPELPIESGFFEWACEYFQEPQMSPGELDEPGSERYLERFYRKTRNEKIMAETQMEKDMSLTGNWANQYAHLNNSTQPYKLAFAQFEPHLVVADNQDGISVWDWEKQIKLNRFCNDNSVGTKITDLKLLNEDDSPSLLVGSSEGVVRIYRHYESYEDIELASAWRAITDLLPAQKSSGLITEWQQSRGSLLVGGDVRVIKIWDAPRELCMSEIHTQSSSPVTSLVSDQVAGNVIVAGFGDGSVRVFDRRIDSWGSMVQCWKSHSSWIVNTRIQRGGARELVTSSTDGQVCLWDIRLPSPILNFSSKQGISVMDVHEHAPVIACGSRHVQLWSTLGVPVTTIRNNTGYMNKSAELSGLVFHPHRMMVAINNKRDSFVTIYNCIDQ